MLLFVYGTLKKGQEAHALIHGSDCLGEGYIYGQFYDTGAGFPAATIPGGQKIYGELYEVTEKTLAAVDEYEGYDEGDPGSGLYNRIETDVFIKGGMKRKAWVYFIPEDGLSLFFCQPIPGGKW